MEPSLNQTSMTPTSPPHHRRQRWLVIGIIVILFILGLVLPRPATVNSSVVMRTEWNNGVKTIDVLFYKNGWFVNRTAPIKSYKLGIGMLGQQEKVKFLAAINSIDVSKIPDCEVIGEASSTFTIYRNSQPLDLLEGLCITDPTTRNQYETIIGVFVDHLL